jgi:hypothetical protein
LTAFETTGLDDTEEPIPSSSSLFKKKKKQKEKQGKSKSTIKTIFNFFTKSNKTTENDNNTLLSLPNTTHISGNMDSNEVSLSNIYSTTSETNNAYLSTSLTTTTSSRLREYEQQSSLLNTNAILPPTPSINPNHLQQNNLYYPTSSLPFSSLPPLIPPSTPPAAPPILSHHYPPPQQQQQQQQQQQYALRHAEAAEALLDMGFPAEAVLLALEASEDDIHKAILWLSENQELQENLKKQEQQKQSQSQESSRNTNYLKNGFETNSARIPANSITYKEFKRK